MQQSLELNCIYVSIHVFNSPVSVCTHVRLQICRNQTSPSTIWGPGIKLRPSALATGTFTL